jgi:uncharacterized protein
MKTIKIKVKPASSQNKIEKINDLSYLVWLTAQPVENKANELLVKLMSKHLGVAKSLIEIKAGKNSRDKVLIIY